MRGLDAQGIRCRAIFAGAIARRGVTNKGADVSVGSPDVSYIYVSIMLDYSVRLAAS